ncbi:GDP-Man:Man(3)GlcNAc(2)-PP-Dol alpha-1,2-mannosyltransferase [Debaryomyces fabryi]|uniref:GDP-Man:Man(3)GlcNAc(2)-PP-Dol alpha-1,2-mannosyltransferase n=1 Tax=Debaryomyces fabryi TaxID=58627 RepID=A0A0V1PZ35_9ASCO|nr:GDP-Man:Man(3)GlcNAc(2)-PP-Dol alpha-1,2-mannosyltransferase [Debaryomyces fabryi]KSA01505.1 GDP-Man:Man(3)GlcNAc(2)-PP-Dol alpha-1,2-mannosyltransferase [Debaryomyces fabryi]CUM52237.1 unnamed protein product [Debaryomyces fabryi]
MSFLVVVGVIGFVAFGILQVVSTVLPRLLLVPSQNWQDKIKKEIEQSMTRYLKVGNKRSSFRRRLVLASKQPSFYNNFVNNKIKFAPVDLRNDDGGFLEEMTKREVRDPRRKIIYGFFHPYANNGGGGERVLWQAVQATLAASDRNIVAIYTTNYESEPSLILDKVETKFQIADLDEDRIVFIYLRKYARMIDGDYWKLFTLIGQLFGSIVLSWEAMFELSPDIWIDTIGLPGSYLLVSLVLKIPIMSYVHYPIIQPEMFNKLKFQGLSQIKVPKVSEIKSDVFAIGKLIYWSGVFYFYKYLGSLVNITLANGSWTFNHISNIWTLNKDQPGYEMDILYPPCGTEMLTKNVETLGQRENKLLFIAQFRPEKRHSLILNQYFKFLANATRLGAPLKSIPTLVFLGSCRTPDDTKTLQDLKQEVEDLKLHDYVEFVVDCSYEDIMVWLSKVKFGLNAMWNEHFGIGVVEYMSRGVIPLCHASAGPLLDIVTNWNNEPTDVSWYNNTGFFFKDKSDPDFDLHLQSGADLEFLQFSDRNNKGSVSTYPTLAKLLDELFMTNPDLVSEDRLQLMRENGVRSVLKKFSNAVFSSRWVEYSNLLSNLERVYREERRTGIEKVY